MEYRLMVMVALVGTFLRYVGTFSFDLWIVVKFGNISLRGTLERYLNFIIYHQYNFLLKNICLNTWPVISTRRVPTSYCGQLT